jgi:hypothetical protein
VPADAFRDWLRELLKGDRKATIASVLSHPFSEMLLMMFGQAISHAGRAQHFVDDACRCRV